MGTSAKGLSAIQNVHVEIGPYGSSFLVSVITARHPTWAHASASASGLQVPAGTRTAWPWALPGNLQ